VDKIPKPSELHDRVDEWAALSEFASDPDSGTVLGIVYGRRRQGKTLLLELLAEATEGFTFTGLQQANTQNLADLAAAYAGFAGVPAAAFGSWTDAVDALLTVGGRLGRPVPVVLDEFPYLVEQAPELPSVVQRALSPRSSARSSGQVRLILCGSAFTLMRGLLAGSGPLRGRARLELLVQPFLVIRPFEARLVGRNRARVWDQLQDMAESLINGPHLEDLARSWCIDHADPQTLGGLPGRCGRALVACHEHKKTHELDVVISSDPPQGKRQILAIGEVKATTWHVGRNQLERLHHIRSLLPAGAHAGPVKLLLFSRAGFTSDLIAQASVNDEVELIDLPRLYHGS
jgi:hypothetical protein